MASFTVNRYQSPAGELLMGEVDGKICMCDWVTSPRHERNIHKIENWAAQSAIFGQSETLARAREQISEYFDRKRTSFDLPLHMVGTSFQKSVWKDLARFKYGQTATYAELARALGRGEAVRAVASAVAANPISIIVPCHRIIGISNPYAYAGGGQAKRLLLDIEKATDY